MLGHQQALLIAHFDMVSSNYDLNSSPPGQKMAAISQTTFFNVFSWMKSFVFWYEFHWSLFLRFQLTMSQHWSGKGWVQNRQQAIIYYLFRKTWMSTWYTHAVQVAILQKMIMINYKIDIHISIENTYSANTIENTYSAKTIENTYANASTVHGWVSI